jgi:uncharacterized protein YlxW (UPF0749 family)
MEKLNICINNKEEKISKLNNEISDYNNKINSFEIEYEIKNINNKEILNY